MIIDSMVNAVMSRPMLRREAIYEFLSRAYGAGERGGIAAARGAVAEKMKGKGRLIALAVIDALATGATDTTPEGGK